ncbi:hypothetical protein FJT64_013422 [Amphibalanus amphitrite]|uniref:Uncharacterized protein n=1 Tax=Amphibalanus amphitrite TaxID=1232801 RepID=A0A6A4V0A5_AMPAM|nr:hypothetical protein FJT64_013422 [Amphibalanus amphitrite]
MWRSNNMDRWSDIFLVLESLDDKGEYLALQDPAPGLPSGHAWSEQYRAYGSGAAAVTVDLARAPRHWGARRANTDADDYKTVQQEDFKTWSDVFRIAGQGRQAVRGCAGAHPQRPPRAVPAATGLPILLSAPAYVRSRTILIAWRRQ